MTETKIMLIGFIKILLPVIGGCLYSMGGREDTHWYFKKFMRRFIAPAIVVGGSIAINIGFGIVQHQVFYLVACGIAYALLCAGLTIGYGADTTVEKIEKRARCAMIVSLTSAVMVITTGQYVLALVQISFCMIASVGLGVWNNLSAPNEEQMIGTSYFLFFPFFN